ncbi:hypothetical protein AB6A40_001064 [Gnathostoma spinigerum]|uniref:Enoyl reductase (ER) domain-containing protein n=1 Tax=Gnathostoma spinigerum TaxID=75299 RepID=A0ABD6EDG8_9BILA
MNNIGRWIFNETMRQINSVSKRGYLAASLMKPGENLRIVKRKDGEAHRGQAILKVEAAGVNYADVHMIEGKYHLKPDFPFTPGFEIAGTVLSVGEGVTRVKKDDRVLVLKPQGTGGFAEQCVISETDHVVPIPYTLDFETAASLAVCYGSAYLALQNIQPIKERGSVLILSCRGSLGLAAIDLAQNVFKHQVFAASDSEEKLEKLRSTGVYSTINWERQKMAKAVRTETDGKGVDLVIDTVGGKAFHEGFEAIKVGGHIVSMDFSSEVIPTLNLLDLHRLQASVSGVWFGGRSFSEVDNIMGVILKFFDEGYLNNRIGKSYCLAEINECLKDMRDGRLFGKAVIRMR